MADEQGIHTEARVEEERGRFVVWLDTYMADAEGNPTGIRSSRINDYPTRRTAEIAAHWMERAARKKGGGAGFGL